MFYLFGAVCVDFEMVEGLLLRHDHVVVPVVKRPHDEAASTFQVVYLERGVLAALTSGQVSVDFLAVGEVVYYLMHCGCDQRVSY